MKMRILAGIAAAALASGTVHAAPMMECCKDGKCACCAKDKKDDASKDAPKDMPKDHQH